MSAHGAEADMGAPIDAEPLCTGRYELKAEMRDGKYPQGSRSRGPRAKSRPPQDPDDRLREDRRASRQCLLPQQKWTSVWTARRCAWDPKPTTRVRAENATFPGRSAVRGRYFSGKNSSATASCSATSGTKLSRWQ